MGRGHAKSVMDGKAGRNRLVAVADVSAESLAKLEVPDSVRRFDSPSAMMQSGEVDAVLIATPHFSHVDLAIEALGHGLHVLVEKPIAVDVLAAQQLIDAHAKTDLVFSAMFNQRTDPTYQTLRDLIQNGELGAIQRINWIITNWFRPNAYYASGSWRATWAGEGGGVLLNQCPHQLDLWQWLFGKPQTVQAICRYGQYHDVEVEDDVTAIFNYADGATGVFITTTGEAPGTNRLEVAADRGKVIVEDGQIRFTRNVVPTSEFTRTTKGMFSAPDVWNIDIPVAGPGPQHAGIMQNFADAILDGTPLLAPGGEGIHSVEMANAMLLSAAQNKRIDLPVDAQVYRQWLEERMKESKYKG